MTACGPGHLTALAREPVADGLTAFAFALDGAAPWDVDEELLSADELARAARFRFERDRWRYVRGRATLRRLLGDWVGEDPGALRFSYNGQGKPALPGGPEFNLAHCEGEAVLALSTLGRVGIDIERSRDGFASEAIAEHFFAPGEVRRLRALPAQERQDAFFRCWTRKEAFLKAIGGGLSVPLRDFEVAFEPGAGPAVLSCAIPGEDASAWGLHDISAQLHDISAQSAFGPHRFFVAIAVEI